MSFIRKAVSQQQKPEDSPDLSWMMGFVTTVGGLSAYTSKRSVAGLVAGCGLGALFGISGAMIASERPENHEIAHQIALIGAVLFGGAMGYRAGANPYVGPGGAMLAALGGLNSFYHLVKWVEWRSFEAARVQEVERLLREHYTHLERRGSGAPGVPVVAEHATGEAKGAAPSPPLRGLLPGSYHDGPTLPRGGR